MACLQVDLGRKAPITGQRTVCQILAQTKPSSNHSLTSSSTCTPKCNTKYSDVTLIATGSAITSVAGTCHHDAKGLHKLPQSTDNCPFRPKSTTSQNN